jgi:hypothetical protein
LLPSTVIGYFNLENITGELRALHPGGGNYKCSPDTFVVAADGSGDVPTIQAAIDAAFEYDIILLEDGVYTGEGNRDLSFRGKKLRVSSISGDPTLCVIDCEGAPGDPHSGFTIDSPPPGYYSELEGVTITNSYATDGSAAIRVDGTTATIRNFVITNAFSTQSGAAIRVIGASPVIEDCVISNATVEGDTTESGAVYAGPGLGGYAAPTIRRCTIDRPKTSGIRIDADQGNLPPFNPIIERVEVRFATGNGMELGIPVAMTYAFLFGCDGVGLLSTTPALQQPGTCRFGGNAGGAVQAAGPMNFTLCTFAANLGSGPQPVVISSSGSNLSFHRSLLSLNSVDLFGDVGSVQMSCCDVFGNTGGDWVGPIAGQLGTNGNFSLDPRFANLEYEIDSSSPCRSGANPCGDHVGAGGIGDSEIYYVSPADEPDGFPSLQKAIDVMPGSYYNRSRTLQLRDGTYTGAGYCDLDFRGKSLVLESEAGSPASVVFDCKGESRAVHFSGGEDSTTVFRNVTIRNGVADRGGAILAESGPRIYNCVIESCSASNGGAIYYAGDDVHMWDLTISGCVAADSGGAIYAAGSLDRGSIATSTFTDCRAGEVGGAVYARNTDVSSCTITRGTVSAGLGGGVYATVGTVQGTTVTMSTAAGGSGGGIYASGRVVGCDVTGCTADYGGAIFAESSPTISGCVVEACSASSGGAVYVLGGEFSVSDLTVTGCAAVDSGGGIYASSTLTPGTVSGCTLTDCESGTAGGAIYANNTIVSGCTITNAAVADGSGGGVHATGTVIGCNVDGCSATSGGGIYADGTVAGSLVSACSADSGGGVYLVAGEIDSCEVVGNVAADNGGGVYGPSMTVTRTLLASNDAKRGGGAWGSGLLEHCTIADNSAQAKGGGLYFIAQSSLEKSIVWGSSAGEGVYCESGSVALTCTDVYGNAGGDFVGCIAGQDSVNGNLSLDPLFIDPEAGIYALLPGSPCLADNNECGVELGYTRSDVEVILYIQEDYAWGPGLRAWITVDPPLDPAEIDLSSVVLRGAGEGGVPVLQGNTSIQGNTLYFFFNRAVFQQVIPQGEGVPVVVSGIIGNRAFTGTDTMSNYVPLVISPGPWESVDQYSWYLIEWKTPAEAASDAFMVMWRNAEYAPWDILEYSAPDDGDFLWYTPAPQYDPCRIQVVVYKNGDIVGIGMSDVPFNIVGGSIATTLSSVEAVVELGHAALRWSTTEESGTAGFRVLRSETEDGQFDVVGEELIPAKGAGSSYEFRDKTMVPNRMYYYQLVDVETDGSIQLLWSESLMARLRFALEQNVPNPFNPATTIAFSLPERSRVRLVIYDVAGRAVRVLADDTRDAGLYRVEWGGLDDRGTQVSSGIYFYRIVAGKRTQTRKMLLLK